MEQPYHGAVPVGDRRRVMKVFNKVKTDLQSQSHRTLTIKMARRETESFMVVELLEIAKRLGSRFVLDKKVRTKVKTNKSSKSCRLLVLRTLDTRVVVGSNSTKIRSDRKGGFASCLKNTVLLLLVPKRQRSQSTTTSAWKQRTTTNELIDWTTTTTNKHEAYQFLLRIKQDNYIREHKVRSVRDR
jgi:hypothetical protein